MMRPLVVAFFFLLVVLAAGTTEDGAPETTPEFRVARAIITQLALNEAPSRYAPFIQQAIDYVNSQKLPSASDGGHGCHVEWQITGGPSSYIKVGPPKLSITIMGDNTLQVDSYSTVTTGTPAFVRPCHKFLIFFCLCDTICNGFVTVTGNLHMVTTLQFVWNPETTQVVINTAVPVLDLSDAQVTGCSVSWFWQHMISWFLGVNDIIKWALQIALENAKEALQHTFNVGQTFEPFPGVTVNYRVSSLTWTAQSNIIAGFNGTLTVATSSGAILTYQAPEEDAGVELPGVWKMSVDSPYNNSGVSVPFSLMNGIQISSTAMNGILWGMYQQSTQFFQTNTTILDAKLNVSVDYTCPYLWIPYNDAGQIGVNNGDSFVTCSQNMTGLPALVLNFTFEALQANCTIYYEGDGKTGGITVHVFAIDAGHFKPRLYWPQIPMPGPFLDAILISTTQAMVPQINRALESYPWELPPTVVPLVAYPVLNIYNQPGCCGGKHGYVELNAYCTCNTSVPAGWMRCQTCTSSVEDVIGDDEPGGADGPPIYLWTYVGGNCTVNMPGKYVNVDRLYPTGKECGMVEPSGMYYRYNTASKTMKLMCDANCTACAFEFNDFNVSNTCYSLENAVSVQFSDDDFLCQQRIVNVHNTFSQSSVYVIQINDTLPGATNLISIINVGDGNDTCLLGFDGLYYNSYLNRTDNSMYATMQCMYGNCTECSNFQYTGVVHGSSVETGPLFWARMNPDIALCYEPSPYNPMRPLHVFFLLMGLLCIAAILLVLCCNCRALVALLPPRPGSKRRSWKEVAEESNAVQVNDFHSALPFAAAVFVALGGTTLAVLWGSAFPFVADQTDLESTGAMLSGLLNDSNAAPLMSSWSYSGTAFIVTGTVVALLFLLLDGLFFKRARGYVAITGLVILIVSVFAALLGVPLLYNMPSLVGANVSPGSVIGEHAEFKGALQTAMQMSWTSFLLGRMSVLFMLVYGAMSGAMFLGYASAFVFAAWDVHTTRVRLGRYWTAVGIIQALQPVACILPAVLLGQTFGATVWWMLAWLATWLWPVLGHALLRVGAHTHTNLRLSISLFSCAAMFLIHAQLTLFLIQQQDPLLNMLQAGFVWLGCVLICYPAGCYGTIIDQLSKPVSGDVSSQKAEPKPPANSKFGRFLQRLTFRNVFLLLGTLALVIDVMVFQLRDLVLFSPEDELSAILSELLNSPVEWPSNSTIFSPALELYSKFSWVRFSLMLLLTLVCVAMSLSVILDLGIRGSKYAAIVAGAIVCTAVLVVVTPSYLDATDLSSLCPFCAPRFNSAVHTIASSVVGVFCAALLAITVVVALIAVPPSAVRALTAVKLAAPPDGELFRWADFSLNVVIATTPISLVLPATVIVQMFAGDDVLMLSWTLLIAPPVAYVIMRQVAYRLELLASPRVWATVTALSWSVLYVTSVIALATYIVVKQGYADLFLAHTVYDPSFWLEVTAEVLLSNVILTDIIQLTTQ